VFQSKVQDSCFLTYGKLKTQSCVVFLLSSKSDGFACTSWGGDLLMVMEESSIVISWGGDLLMVMEESSIVMCGSLPWSVCC